MQCARPLDLPFADDGLLLPCAFQSTCGVRTTCTFAPAFVEPDPDRIPLLRRGENIPLNDLVGGGERRGHGHEQSACIVPYVSYVLRLSLCSLLDGVREELIQHSCHESQEAPAVGRMSSRIKRRFGHLHHTD